MAFEGVIFIKLKSPHNGIEASTSGSRANLNELPGWDAKKEANSQSGIEF